VPTILAIVVLAYLLAGVVLVRGLCRAAATGDAALAAQRRRARIAARR
jgi:hypothetical protein